MGHRTCSVCGKQFVEGYCHNGGDDYFCGDECLHTRFTEEEWDTEFSGVNPEDRVGWTQEQLEQASEYNDTNSYFTDWEYDDFDEEDAD